MLGLSILTFIAPLGQQTVLADSLDGAIAYVSHNHTTGDEIRLIDPDGSNDRLLYRTGDPYPVELTQINHLTWKPDASELAFASSHEESCSLYQSDIYAIGTDGKNYRRLTDPPACGDRAGIPVGTVTVPVINSSDESGPFTIYLEGAQGPVEIALAPGASTEITFRNVADYGNQEQFVVWAYGELRNFWPGAEVDVQPGRHLTTGELEIFQGLEHYGFQWPNYRPDGLQVASIFNRTELWQVSSSNRESGLVGERLASSIRDTPDFLAWGPTEELSDLFLYEDWSRSAVDGRLVNQVFLGSVSDPEGIPVMDIDPTFVGKTLLGLAWLPDGSGFLYSQTEMVNYRFKSDLWVYSFSLEQSFRLTGVPYGFIRAMASSPDATKVVYEYQTYGDWYDLNPEIDLWVLDMLTDEQTLLVENASNPAWSPVPIPDNNPVPLLTGINPSAANAGGAGFTLTASGSSFVSGSVVHWNGADLTTTYVNATTLTAQVPANKITAAGTARVTVYTPGPGGGESGARTFTINVSVPTNPVPVLTSLKPSVVRPGGSGFTLVVNGRQFINASVVRWGGVNLPTTYGNGTSLTAQVTAAQIASIGLVSVTVFNPAPGGGESQPLTITIIETPHSIYLPVLIR